MERVIIAGVDRSARSRAAADWAAREALLRGLPLRVVHVPPSSRPDPADQWPYRPETVADRAVSELTGRHRVLAVRGVTLSGSSAAVLRAWAEQAELLVLGLRGEGGHAGVAVGSTAAALAAGCARPVVLVPGTFAGRWQPGRADGVVLGIDARDPADGPIGFAFEAARLHGVRLHAVHCWTFPAQAARSPFPVLEEDRATWEDDEVQALSDALRPWLGKYPDVEVLQDVRLLAPAEALAHASGNADLVVTGQGATALALLRHAQCPVAVVPA
ncbi:universal stress protein [Streptomyces sp. S.PB5]|uniref:universal stress protein n=1 Tax=Streptomyces sp. S.PB5 TaxID=3020844 RepID=UPI0025B0DD75|nr:universal stress protein [Streptomyces sp. S.PB5]MDN3027841.1 universal stress protein [Streptomyces sp. S.PB5]